MNPRLYLSVFSIALAAAVVQGVFGLPELQNVQVTPSTETMLQTASVAVAFQAPVSWPADGTLRITFPLAYRVSAVSGAKSFADIDGSFSVLSDRQTLTIQRDGKGTILAEGSVVDDLRIFGVMTPSVAGTTDAYRIVLLDHDGQELADGLAPGTTFSSAQAIPPAPLTLALLTPNGGQTFSAGDVVMVEWKTAGGQGIDTARLRVSLDNGTTYQPLVEGLPPTGGTEWTVSGVSAKAKIQVQILDAYGAIIREDENDRPFAIR